MRWRVLAVTVTAALVVLVAAGPAAAKGADQATLSGPGLTRPVVVGAGTDSAGGEPGSGGQLATLSEDSGLFAAMFGPDGGQRLESGQPAGALGPRYQLTYRVPDGNPTASTVTQDLYPSAAGGPVTYTRAGQVVFGTTTSGGWYRAPAEFAALLVTLGVPGVEPLVATTTATPAATDPGGVAGNAVSIGAGGGSTRTGYWIAIGAAVLAACAAVAVLVYRLRARAGRSARGA
ncbi:hypothetical protein [Rugosimonospora africana]|uniref:Uncharacterized protein n=1 Tax=Rugosimonospora africana TaxID=556532 RepID=A0A8J3VTN2_9ACTN|nr:hypothetical protein [Rugosimonospora africana]GIH17698.1 hypothetical protein Raf01_58700 [Rugosimonospora africana]